MTPAAPTHPSVASGRRRLELAEAIKRAWQDGRAPDAAAALREHPDLADDRALALDLAYEEFCTREEAGEALDPEDFCAHFPFGASLRRLLTVHRFLDEHPDALGAAPAPQAWPAGGETVGDFLVLRELGRGSFSRAYLAAETTAGNRPVALKVSTEGGREAATLGPLAHPHLIPVLSSPTVGAWTVVAMPFVGTATLEDVTGAVWRTGRPAPRGAGALLGATCFGGRHDDPPFPGRAARPLDPQIGYETAAAKVAAGLFSAVAHLHERNIAHRDIKPSNVLLAPGGHPYLLDFNLASRVTDPWRLVGTLPYMAPEQLRLFTESDGGSAPDGRPGDVFACGVVLFELLTGRHPFVGKRAGDLPPRRDLAAAALLAAQRAGTPDPGALNPRIRRAVRDVVRRCLALDPAARPTAAEAAELLSRAARRRPWRVPAVVAAGTGALALALGSVLSGSTPPAAPPASLAFSAPDPVVPTPFERGMQLYHEKKYREASDEFLAAGAANGDGRAYAYAAYCIARGYNPVRAVGPGDKAIDLGHRTAPVFANRAYGHFLEGRHKEAKSDCDAALDLDPNLLPARLTRAVTALQVFRTTKGTGVNAVSPEAIDDIDCVVAGAPTDPDVWLTAAQLYLLAPNRVPARRDRAAECVHNAVRCGKAPDQIQRNPTLRPLAGHPTYEAALALHPVAAPVLPNSYLVDPIP